MNDDTAQRVLSAIDEDEMVQLASELLKIPSFKTEESDVATFLADFFEQCGYVVDLQEVEAGRYQTIATLKGRGGGRSLMLNGHMDIDPLAFGWKRDPWTPSREGDRLYAAGANNMKGGLTSIITAAEAIRKVWGRHGGRPGCRLRSGRTPGRCGDAARPQERTQDGGRHRCRARRGRR